MNTVSKQIAPRTLKSVLTDKNVLQQIRRALPAHMDADRIARIAITAATKTPKLNQCTIESVMKCLLDLSAMGLEPDGRSAHLIPYKRECTVIVDYKGLVELAYRSGRVKSIHADVVHKGDLFSFNLGKVVEHTPWAFRIDDRPSGQGEMFAAYCIVKLDNDAEKHEIMTRSQVEAIRRRSKAKDSGPWKTDFNEMAKKTVFRRASKWIPLSAEIRNHFEVDFDSRPEPKQVRRSELNEVIDGESEPVIQANNIADDSEILGFISIIKTKENVDDLNDFMISIEKELEGMENYHDAMKLINEAANEQLEKLQ